MLHESASSLGDEVKGKFYSYQLSSLKNPAVQSSLVQATRKPSQSRPGNLGAHPEPEEPRGPEPTGADRSRRLRWGGGLRLSQVEDTNAIDAVWHLPPLTMA